VSVVYRLENVGYAYGESRALDELSVEIRAGQLTAVVGPNGAGKSTLMSLLSGVRDDYTGACGFEGKEVSRWNKRELARRAAFVPQAVRLEFPFTAEQVVYMGRTPYCHGLFETEEDREAVDEALALTDAAPFRLRPFRQLSGGEKQRVVLASALAQRPSTLLLDEPTTFLDLKHQISIYVLLRELAREGKTVVAVTHDLNLAAAYADRILAFADGRLASDGTPSEVVRPEVVERIFDTRVVVHQADGERPWIHYG
jgi:iron complex transport system ATP-binding protein